MHVARSTAATSDGALESLTRIGAEAAGVDHAVIVLEARIYLAHAQALGGAPDVGLAVLDAAVAGAGEDATLYAAAVDRARAACLVALDRSTEARERLDAAVEAARSQGLLYEELLARRARAPSRRAGREGRGGAARDRSPRAAPRARLTA